MASYRNAQSVQLIEPNVLDSSGFPISQDDSFTNKLSFCFMELSEDRGRSHFSGWHDLWFLSG